MMTNVKDMMIRKPSFEYRNVREYEGKFFDWEAGEHLLRKGLVVDEIFHPLEHDIRFIKDLEVTLRDGVKILADVYLPATGSGEAMEDGPTDSAGQFPAIIAWSPYGKNSGNSDRYKILFGLLGLDQKRMSGLQKFEGPDPDYWCPKGYAIVHPDPRGIGHSEGDSTMLGTQEGRDGYDLVEWVARQLAKLRMSKVLVLSKTDLVDADTLSAQRESAAKLSNWDAVVACSAVDGSNVDAFVDTVVSFLPEGPMWFPADMETDQPIEVVVAEFIREKILLSFRDEIPHAIGVQTEEITYLKKKDLYRIRAIIYTEHDSQKGMIIGKGGKAIRQIGTEARIDLERILGCRVFLDLSVKVKKNWRRDASQIRRFGYGEGA